MRFIATSPPVLTYTPSVVSNVLHPENGLTMYICFSNKIGGNVRDALLIIHDVVFPPIADSTLLDNPALALVKDLKTDRSISYLLFRYYFHISFIV